MPESKFPPFFCFLYTICKSEFAKDCLFWVCFPGTSFEGAALVLHDCLFVECVVYMFSTAGLCKNASPVEQTTALSKYLQVPTLSDLALVDFLA